LRQKIGNKTEKTSAYKQKKGKGGREALLPKRTHLRGKTREWSKVLSRAGSFSQYNNI
jgi:hypothetical protein